MNDVYQLVCLQRVYLSGSELNDTLKHSAHGRLSQCMPIIKAVTIAASDCEPESVIYNALELFFHLISQQTVSVTMNSKQALLIVRKLKDVLTRVCLYVTKRLRQA